MSLFILSMLLLAFIPLFFRAIRLDLDIVVFIFPIILAVFLIYDIHVMIVQYRFFRKWGYRMEQLVNLEEKLMSEKLDEKGLDRLAPSEARSSPRQNER